MVNHSILMLLLYAFGVAPLVEHAGDVKSSSVDGGFQNLARLVTILEWLLGRSEIFRRTEKWLETENIHVIYSLLPMDRTHFEAILISIQALCQNTFFRINIPHTI